MEYVLGFRFDNIGNVLLIQKNRPNWQKGRVNGVGGKIEPGENPDDAMCREFIEETGIHTDTGEWELVSCLEEDDHSIWVYRSFGEINSAQSLTDEELLICQTNQLPVNSLENVANLIRKCLNV